MGKGFAGCGGCGRHVRGGESICPFCGAAIVEAARPIFDAAGPRLSRAAMLAASAAIVAGCSSSDPTPSPTNDDASVGVDGSVQPAYGAPFLGDASDIDDGSMVAQPVYGAPVGRTDAGAGSDSGGGIAEPVYGAPAPPLDGGN